jgi:hypothetical protein
MRNPRRSGCENGPALAPNHGFAITIHPNSVIWVDASYEISESPHKFGRFNSQLGRLKAERKTWNDIDQGVERFHESIVARGFDRRTPIIFTIQLDTTAENRVEAIRVFQALVESFRQIRIRP